MTLSGALATVGTFTQAQGQPETLIQASDGNLYGTSASTIFRITTAGEVAILHTFNVVDGSRPMARLLQARNGILYGTTSAGGMYNLGTVFALDIR